MSELRDITLAPSGEKKIGWAKRFMPLLASIESDFVREKPFAGMKVTASLHIEAKTANFCRLMQAGGAEMHVTGCNPLSTQDDVVAALVAGGMEVYAWHDCTAEEYDRHLAMALACSPDIIIDDGGDLVGMVHDKLRHLIPNIIGGCEETTTGVIRLKAMENDGALMFPMVNVNDARCKHFFDNRYGTGQSVWDGFIRATNLVVAGKKVVVAGYGWCGRGIAMRAKGLGAEVIITEIDPVKALEAIMDGYTVMTMDEAAPLGDFFITSTGCCGVITERHFMQMKNNAVMANGGHFDVEVDVSWLEKHSTSIIEGRNDVTRGYVLPNGRTVFVLAAGRLVNLASGDGHPVEIMDMSFTIQALSARFLVENRGKLGNRVIDVPDSVDYDVARRAIAAKNVRIDVLTPEQEKYINSWKF